MKRYVLILSQYFLKGHPKEGNHTEFHRKYVEGSKIHTIRTNYDFWKSRIEEINKGYAYLSIRIWEGKPYRSKKYEFARLYEAGIQKIQFKDLSRKANVEGKLIDLPLLSKNDGLDFNDFFYWFKSYNLKEPLAIIHFTQFRY
ncbi:MAG: hypothetical protein J1E16_09570 [Muribaculaceae bacterium]|nr:hypothetical protein [Muribaculaceae bacterium]